MTQEKVEQILKLTRNLKGKIIIVTNTQIKVFIDFNKKYNKATHTDKMFIHYWNVVFRKWNILPLEDIDFIEFH